MDGGKDRPGPGRLARFVRGRRPDRNPLRRACDRLETAVLAMLVVAFLAAAPFVAQVCGAAAQASAHRDQLAQEASSRQVPALVLTDASAPQASAYTTVAPETQVRWTGPDGSVRTGDMAVPAGTRAGTTVPVWITSSGQLTSPPLLGSQVAGQADLAGTAGVAVLGFVIAAAGLGTRRVLDKRRMAAWEAEWRATGPRWTARA